MLHEHTVIESLTVHICCHLKRFSESHPGMGMPQCYFHHWQFMPSLESRLMQVLGNFIPVLASTKRSSRLKKLVSAPPASRMGFQKPETMQ